MKILVAIDMSASWKAVIDEVARQPWPCGSGVRVLTVDEPSHIWEARSNHDKVAGDSSGFVEAAAQYLRCAGLEARGVIRRGDPKAEVLSDAEESHTDLVIVGSRGHNGLTRILLGSVAQAVVKFAPCSVRIVRPQPQNGEHRVGLRILLPTDGSSCSITAARDIAGRPWLPYSELEILSVVEAITPSGHFPYPPYFDPAGMEALRGDSMTRSQEAIAATEQILSGCGLKISESILVPVATPEELILEEAANFKPDLIVVGSHGRHGLPRLLMGSVSEAVALHADCSVEIVKCCVSPN